MNGIIWTVYLLVVLGLKILKRKRDDNSASSVNISSTAAAYYCSNDVT